MRLVTGLGDRVRERKMERHAHSLGLFTTSQILSCCIIPNLTIFIYFKRWHCSLARRFRCIITGKAEHNFCIISTRYAKCGLHMRIVLPRGCSSKFPKIHRVKRFPICLLMYVSMSLQLYRSWRTICFRICTVIESHMVYYSQLYVACMLTHGSVWNHTDDAN